MRVAYHIAYHVDLLLVCDCWWDMLMLQAMQCLVQLASVRRSLFSSDESRVQYLVSLVTISVELMKRSQGNQSEAAL
jgi:hypothetical protein